MNKLNINATIDAYADGIAIPPNLIRTEEEVTEIEAGQKQQAAAQQMAANAAPIAKAAKDASEVDLTTDNPITRAMNLANAPT
jgi:hypothetical protein